MAIEVLARLLCHWVVGSVGSLGLSRLFGVFGWFGGEFILDESEWILDEPGIPPDGKDEILAPPF